MKKKLVFALLAMSILSANVMVSASEINAIPAVETANEAITPYLNVTTSTYITTDGWSTVATDNNWIPAKIRFTNDANNPGQVEVRVVNSSGSVVVDPVSISTGTTESLGSRVPAFSGTYSVQVKASYTTGYYKFTLKDW